MAAPADLYQDIILEHSRTPRNHGTLVPCDCQATAYNPVCGDEVEVYLILNDQRVADVRFSGQGCALSRASASLMTEHLKGMTVDTARRTVHRLLTILSASTEDPTTANESLPGDIAALTVVRNFPARIQCVTLCWKAMDEALTGRSG